MSRLRKIFAASVMMMTVFAMTVVVNPVHAAEASDGDLIKMSGISTVYYFKDGKRFVFPNEQTFFSWYDDFSGVKTIPASELQSYPLGGNVVMRPGTWLVKITTDPTVYAVEANGTLRSIVSEENAIDLYGSNWADMVVDVPDSFFTNYTVGDPLAAGNYEAGRVVNPQGTMDLYYFDGTEYRLFADEQAFLANNFQFNYVVTTDMEVTPSGEPIVGAEAGFMNVAQNASTGQTGDDGETVTGGDLTVALAADTAAADNIPQSATGVPFVSFNVTAGADAAVIDDMVVTRGGLGEANDFSAVYLYEGNNRLTTGRTLNNTTNQATFNNVNYEVPAGTTVTLTVRADMAASGINNNYLMIEEASDITLTGGGSVSGSFPVKGNTMVGVSQTVGDVTIAKNGTLANPSAGEDNAKLAQFTIQAGSTEDVEIDFINLYYAGTVTASNLSDFELKQAGNTIATADMIDDNRLLLEFDTPFEIEKGNTRTFELYADISNEAMSTRTTKFYLNNDADLSATGQSYGYGVGVTRSSYNGTSTYYSETTVQAGQVTITYQGAGVQDFATQGEDVELLRFNITAQSNIEIQATDVNLTAGGTDADEDITDNGGLVTLDDSVNYTDVRLVDVNTGSLIAGPTDLSGLAAGDDDEQTVSYTDYWYVDAGETITVAVTADIENFTPAANETIKATLVAFDATDIRNLDTNLYVSTDDIVPSGNIVGAAHNVKAGGGSATVSGTPAAQTYIDGTTGVDLTGVNIVADGGKDVIITGLTVVADGADQCATETDCVLQVELWAGDTQLGTAKSLSTNTATFSSFQYTVPKGETKSLMIKGDLTTVSPALSGNDDTLAVDVTAISAQDEDGNTATVSGTTVAGPDHTIVDAGTMTVTLGAGDLETEARVVLAGATNVPLAKYRFTAANEELKITKMKIKFGGNNADDVSSLSLWTSDGTRLTNDVLVTDDTTDYVSFENFITDFIVAKDNSETIVVKGNMNTISAGADSGAAIQVSLDKDTDFEARGTGGSGTTLTSCGTGDLAAYEMILRKSSLTFTELDLPTTSITNSSELEVYKFKIAADGNDAAIKQLAFGVTVTDNVGTDNTLTLGSFKLYKGSTNITGLVDIHNLAGATIEETNTIGESGGTAVVTWASEEIIGEGTEVTYTLRATPTGFTTPADDDSFRVLLNSDSSASSYTYLVDLDTDGSQQTASLGDSDATNTDGTEATTAVLGNNIIWSDMSAVPHDSTLVDSETPGTDPTSSADWANSALLKNLPFSGKTMTY